MKSLSAVVLAALLLAPMSVYSADKPAKTASKSAVFKVVPSTSEVRWIGKKVTGQHNGTIQVKSGNLLVSKGILSGGTVEIDMPSITVLDLTDPDSNGKLTGHLKSDDFFGVESHPVSTFTIKEAKAIPDSKAGEPNTQITGDLMIKGATHPLSFPATVSIAGKILKATAKEVKVDRTLYNVRYGSNKFFDNLGNKVIDDIFIIDFDLTAKK